MSARSLGSPSTLLSVKKLTVRFSENSMWLLFVKRWRASMRLVTIVVLIVAHFLEYNWFSTLNFHTSWPIFIRFDTEGIHALIESFEFYENRNWQLIANFPLPYILYSCPIWIIFNIITYNITLLTDCMFRKNWRSETYSLIRAIQGTFVSIFRHLSPLHVQWVKNDRNIMLF
jgi:hypothetical protein